MPTQEQEMINKILQYRAGIIQQNYTRIQEEFESHYNLPEIDPLRNEICLCLMFGFYQAAITLTNHLFEKAFKLFLTVNYSKNINGNKEDDEKGIVKKMIDFFKPGHLELENKDLSYVINKSCNEGIITKEHKKILHEFRVKFRNAYGHADAEKTFGDSKVSVQGVKIDENKNLVTEQPKMELISNLLIGQGIMQAMIAEMEAIPYFETLDEIIRHAKDIVVPTSNKNSIK